MKKKIAAAVGSILVVFLIVNCVWGIYAYNYISRYTDSLTVSEGAPSYFASKDGFSYSATRVKYLDFTNNLAVTDEKNENSLIIWKKLSKTEYGVTIKIDSSSYQMYVNKDGRPTGSRNASNADEIYEENKDAINNLLKQSNDFWGVK